MLWLRLAAACAATGAACGCADLAPVVSHESSAVQTDALIYTLRRDSIPWTGGWRGEWRAYVLATYRNLDTATVHFRRCIPDDTLPVFSVRRTGADSTRTLFSDFGWACVGGVAPGAIPPGAAVTVRAPLGTVDQPRMQPPLQPGWLVGLMRVELELCRQDSLGCHLLPQEARQSNAFEVRF